jgi:RNA polymerase sigma-70 factor (ECF subfamily)
MSLSDSSLLHTWAVTTWTKIFQGRGDDADAKQARHDLVVRYHEVVYRYFLNRLRDPNTAAELYSNFAVHLLTSDALLRSADPALGRFRHYLKRSLHNLIMDHYRKQARERKLRPLRLEATTPDVPGTEEDGFAALWSQELLNQAWKGLEAADRGGLRYQVLRYQADHPTLGAPRIAEQLGARLGKELTPENVRKLLQRARQSFAALLLEEVERSLEDPTLDDLEQELIDLRLLSYCKKALAKRRRAACGETRDGR